MTFDDAKRALSQPEQESDEMLSHQLSADSLGDRQARLSDELSVEHSSAEADRVDRLFREAPLAAPSPGFAERVMAAIAALPLPAYVRRELSVGLALGLLTVMMLVVPLLVVGFVLLASTVSSPSAWNSVVRGATDAANTMGGLVLDVGSELEALVSGTAILPALIAIVIPLVVLWGWVVWQFWGKGRVSLER